MGFVCSAHPDPARCMCSGLARRCTACRKRGESLDTLDRAGRGLGNSRLAKAPTSRTLEESSHVVGPLPGLNFRIQPGHFGRVLVHAVSPGGLDKAMAVWWDGRQAVDNRKVGSSRPRACRTCLAT